MSNSVRDMLGFHTRFNGGESFFEQCATAVLDKYGAVGVTQAQKILLSETHKKLIRQAQKQNILHKDVGYVRALRLAEATYFFDIGLKAIDGSMLYRGTSLDLDEAVARAFGELYERVSMKSFTANQEVLYKSYRELQSQKVPIFDIYSLAQATQKQKEQCTELQWNEDLPFRWILARQVRSQERVFVPAQLVYWKYARKSLEPLLKEINTSGLGAGYSFADAVESASGELLQRHSFFSFWYAKKAPPKVKVQSVLESSICGTEVKKLVHGVKEYGFEVFFLNCTLPGMTPSVAVVLSKPGLGWFVGMSANRSLEKAIERGTCEALSIYTWSMNVAREKGFNMCADTVFVEDFCDKTLSSNVRVRAWSTAKIAQRGSFFIEGEEQQFSEPQTKPTIDAVESLERIANKQVYVVSASQQYLDEVGLYSVRVICPNIYTLAYNEKYSTPLLEGEYPKNTYPHPFP